MRESDLFADQKYVSVDEKLVLTRLIMTYLVRMPAIVGEMLLPCLASQNAL